ncbi:MFS transporter, partial [Escherichia coli]|uniref:MFS transporter n=1 Tax=Escherichia coli TaxID=562 RepID=UPI003891266E
MAPCLGPIAGGYLGEAAGWRWIFWVLTIASGLSTLVSLVVQRETYEPVLLERRTKHLRKTLNRPEL